MTAYLLVAAGAVVGAPARYLTDRFVQGRHSGVFPWGTFTVNLIGSFLLGLVTGLTPAGSTAQLLVGTGFCGALTTYSTFSFETVRLAETGHRGAAVLNAAGSVLLGVAAAAVGFVIGT